MLVDEGQLVSHHHHAAVGARGRADAGLEPERDVPGLRLLDEVAAEEQAELVGGQRRAHGGVEGVCNRNQDGARRPEPDVFIPVVARADLESSRVADDLPEGLYEVAEDRFAGVVDLDA